jgi:hypothetical protein
MNIVRTCLAGAALAAIAACSASQPLGPPEKGARFDVTETPPAANGGYLGSGNQTAMCADSTTQLMPDGCNGRGGMLGSGT